MNWLDAVGGFLDGLFWLGLLAVITVLVSQTTRRVLSVRVGWPRTILVCFIAIVTLLSFTSPRLASGELPTDPDGLNRTLLYLGVLILWTFALSAAAVVVLEIMLPTGTLPSFRSIFLGWGERWRRMRRYASIVRIAARHGLGAPLRGFRPAADASHLAVSLRRALQEAGVTFIKLGQMLSTRADVLPPPFISELAQLTNRAEPESWESVRDVLEAQFGQPVAEVFQDIDAEPLASASVAQVHTATLPSGQEVVVKVQRPRAISQVTQDLALLDRLAISLERNAGWARTVGVRALARGFADSLREELDYRVEIDNMAAVRAALAGRGVRVPWVDAEHSGPRVIVMERFDGTPVAQAEKLIAELDPETRGATARRLLGAVLDQIVSEGVFHADLHPGNVVMWPDGEVGLLDFGSVGRLDAVSRRTLGMLLWAIDADDPAAATDALLELLDRPTELDERSLQRSVGILMTRFRGGLGSGGSLQVFSELFGLVMAHGFRVPPPIAAALRSLGALEGTLRLIDPSLDLVGAAREVGRESVGTISPERVKAEFSQRALQLLPLAEQLPRRLNKITADLEQGRLTAHLRIASHPADRDFLIGLVHQLVTAILAGSGVLGGIILATADGGPEVLPGVAAFSLIGATVAFGGFVLGLRAVAMIFATRAQAP